LKHLKSIYKCNLKLKHLKSIYKCNLTKSKTPITFPSAGRDSLQTGWRTWSSRVVGLVTTTSQRRVPLPPLALFVIRIIAIAVAVLLSNELIANQYWYDEDIINPTPFIVNKMARKFDFHCFNEALISLLIEAKKCYCFIKLLLLFPLHNWIFRQLAMIWALC